MDKYTKDFGNRKEEVTKGSQENSERRSESWGGCRHEVSSYIPPSEKSLPQWAQWLTLTCLPCCRPPIGEIHRFTYYFSLKSSHFRKLFILTNICEMWEVVEISHFGKDWPPSNAWGLSSLWFQDETADLNKSFGRLHPGVARWLWPKTSKHSAW